jgi:hypothetical protein
MTQGKGKLRYKQYGNFGIYVYYERICRLTSTPFICLRISPRAMRLLSLSYQNHFSRCREQNKIFMKPFRMSPHRLPRSLAPGQLSSTLYRHLTSLVWVANTKREGFWHTKTGHFNFLSVNMSRLRKLILLVPGVVNCPQWEETSHRVPALQDFYTRPYTSLRLLLVVWSYKQLAT